MVSLKGEGHGDGEKEITKSPTDAFVKHAKGESAEFRDLMIRYLPFTIIGYLLVLLFFSAIFSPLMAFLLWIATGFVIYKIAENYGEEVPWIKQVLEKVQNIGFTSTSPDTAPEAVETSIDESEEEKAADLDNYAEKFDEWRVTKDIISPAFVSAGDRIRNFSFNSPGFYKVRLWMFLILAPLLIWVVMWDIVSWPFLIWFSLWFSATDALYLSRICSLILSYFIIIRIYSHCTNNRNLPINTVYDKELFDFCIDVIGKLSGGQAHGNYDIDIKMNSRNEYCVTEINIGRFFMITNLFNLSGKYSMIDTYLKLAIGEDPEIDDPFDFSELYLIRSLDTLPTVLSPDEITRRLQD